MFQIQPDTIKPRFSSMLNKHGDIVPQAAHANRFTVSDLLERLAFSHEPVQFCVMWSVPPTETCRASGYGSHRKDSSVWPERMRRFRIEESFFRACSTKSGVQPLSVVHDVRESPQRRMELPVDRSWSPRKLQIPASPAEVRLGLGRRAIDFISQ